MTDKERPQHKKIPTLSEREQAELNRKRDERTGQSTDESSPFKMIKEEMERLSKNSQIVNMQDSAFRRGLGAHQEAFRTWQMEMISRHPELMDTMAHEGSREGVESLDPQTSRTPLFETMEGERTYSEQELMYHAGDPNTMGMKIELFMHSLSPKHPIVNERLRLLRAASDHFASYSEARKKIPSELLDRSDKEIENYERESLKQQAAVHDATKAVHDATRKVVDKPKFDKAFKKKDEKTQQQHRKQMGGKGGV